MMLEKTEIIQIKNTFIILIMGFLFFASDTAMATSEPQWQQYSPTVFENAQNTGKTIVVDVFASWCPTCKVQAPVLDSLRGNPLLKNAVFIKVDFDSEKVFLKKHRIPRQSTVLVFKGNRETARSIAQTNPRKLRAAVLEGL